jgi:hypothetical protein
MTFACNNLRGFVPLWQTFIDFYLLFLWQRECGTKMDASRGCHPCANRF